MHAYRMYAERSHAAQLRRPVSCNCCSCGADAHYVCADPSCALAATRAWGSCVQCSSVQCSSPVRRTHAAAERLSPLLQCYSLGAVQCFSLLYRCWALDAGVPSVGHPTKFAARELQDRPLTDLRRLYVLAIEFRICSLSQAAMEPAPGRAALYRFAKSCREATACAARLFAAS